VKLGEAVGAAKIRGSTRPIFMSAGLRKVCREVTGLKIKCKKSEIIRMWDRLPPESTNANKRETRARKSLGKAWQIGCRDFSC